MDCEIQRNKNMACKSVERRNEDLKEDGYPIDTESRKTCSHLVKTWMGEMRAIAKNVGHEQRKKSDIFQ